jgi:CubicO group peptidase (beta-lactamase class C family)
MRNTPPFRHPGTLFGCALLMVISCAHAQDSTDDLKNLGPQENILFWSPQQQLASYRNIDKIFPTRSIKSGDFIHALPLVPADLDDLQIATDDTTLSLDEYFTRQRVAGLLVIKDGKIVYERYGLGNTQESVWISFSVAKSVTSMLVGAAIADGYIKSVDEKVTDYLPRLKGSSYDQSSIRNIMQMSSGVQWDEDYADPESDINISTSEWETVNLYEYLRHKPREEAPGEVFNYNTAETNLVGTLLRSAIGNNLSTYLSEKIWQPLGMEADAYWMLSEPGGGEWGGCCISATLRDYGRIGLFAMHGGVLGDGSQVLPEGWMVESTTPSKGYAGYGYLWWLGENGSYAASGIFGQGIHINPAEKLVIAVHSAREVASKDSDWGLEDALFEALTEALKHR